MSMNLIYFQIWMNSGKEDETLPEGQNFGSCDLGISSDVIEHIRDPNGLLSFLKKLKCKMYIISTPKREHMVRNGPPNNIHHVREWTFHEFQLYLESQGFKRIKSFDGVQNPTTQMHVLRVE
jgi:hypothetical protein